MGRFYLKMPSTAENTGTLFNLEYYWEPASSLEKITFTL
jgi:hypothetical protein